MCILPLTAILVSQNNPISNVPWTRKAFVEKNGQHNCRKGHFSTRPIYPLTVPHDRRRRRPEAQPAVDRRVSEAELVFLVQLFCVVGLAVPDRAQDLAGRRLPKVHHALPHRTGGKRLLNLDKRLRHEGK